MKASGFNNLVRRAQKGDRQALEEVFSRVGPYVGEMARPYEDPIRYRAVEASPIGQGALIRAMLRVGRFQIATSDEDTFAEFRAWVGQIMRRLAILAEWDRRDGRRTPRQGKKVSLRPWLRKR